ncbi:MAG TPA: PAS domain S-box protein, partial [Burkholderiales bacterium]|nr:PAS domain S-box protein [Burkholderiales bacterium]
VYPSEEGLSIFFRDITEARVAEQQSRQSRERLELALEAGEVGFWEWDLSSGEVFLSKQWKRQLGYEDHEIRNEWSEWESRLHPDEGATVVRQVRASALRDDGYHEIEFRLRHRDGSYRWMLSRATNHVDDQGGRRIHRGVHIDITQKKHADEERSIAQRRLHEIVSSLRDGFVALDRTWRYTFVNDAAARLLDRSRDDLIGRNIWDVFPEALDLPFHDVCLRAMQEREPLRLDQYYAPQSRWYRNHFYPTVEGIAIFFEDVSEQKRLETQLADERERYMATFEQPAIGIMHLALDGTLTRINRRMCELLGYQRTELIGKRFQDFTDTSEIERVLSQARSAPATPTQSLERTWTHRTESRFRCRGGRSFYGEFTIALVPNEGDRSAYLVCMVQDISDRKHAQALVEESRRRLSMFAQKLNDAVEQERARISREIHDELGQALTSLKMDLGWLRRRLGEYLPGGPVQLDERLRTMSRFLDETLGTVRRLATELRPALLDNLGLAAALHAQIRHLAARYDIDVEHHLESDLLLTREQATGLYRIAQEALTNIARHANASRVRARLELEGDSVLMEIEDDGIGFDPEMQSSYSLGLVGMAERARLLGGEAEIFSHPGGGTQVRVRVPLSEATEVLSNSAEN